MLYDKGPLSLEGQLTHCFWWQHVHTNHLYYASGCCRHDNTYMLQVDELDAKVRDLRGRVASEQEGHAAMQRAMAADREDITKQGTALVDLGKQVLCQ